MSDSHNSNENTDPSSGVGGLFGWVGIGLQICLGYACLIPVLIRLLWMF